MRKALIVGIDHYDQIGSLHGAVNDAHAVNSVLKRHADNRVNFAQPNLMVASGPGSAISKNALRSAVAELFKGDAEIALFYFSGHGFLDGVGGYLCASDCEAGHDGLSLSEVLVMANGSPAKNKVIILDSCHSGFAGGGAATSPIAELNEGITILTASTAEQYAMESNGSGLFTNLLVDALNGAAANLLGAVTPGSVYAHIDQSLGPWAQRPVFKTNVKNFVSLREAAAPIEASQLRMLTQLFVSQSTVLQLDPSYEPERAGHEPDEVPAPDPARNAEFAVLQAMESVNLVRPVGAPHMWHAAMESKSCELTALGQHYWALVNADLI
ncbi:caspase family protein [Leucobacter chromiiresistens]|uniref:Caspase domain-containing protein n=1 Tax=Leucobacter chromiiresistens TaxID=1079994 RepID=A0A1H0Z4M3_9MICO|nr:caspase family protein [Leucobacter chromiiresistens]SDQ22324.1 Caspase domain-containing protein [Leucobacter chromiiresistens]